MSENKFTFVKMNDDASEHIAAPQYSYWKSVFRQFFSSKVAIIMLLIVLFIVIMSIVHPMISGYDPKDPGFINDRSMHYIWPCLEFPFGTDNVGKNLFDAVWAGTRNSLFIAAMATFISTSIGVVVGMFWGYSKKIDVFMIEVYNVVANVPFTLIVMVLVYALGGGIWQLIFSMSVTSWISVAYFIRVQVMIIRDREYNLASRCLGTPVTKIVTHNILPYLVSVIVTSVARDIPNYISYEVFLSYLGVGLGKDIASLGQMIQTYSPYMLSAPYMFWLPLIVAAAISVSFYIVGQTLADASDPKTHMN